MQEGYRLADSLILLLPYYTTHANRFQSLINKTVEDGYGAPEIFKHFQVEQEFLVAIHFAEKHGDLANTLQLISQQMKYKKELKERLNKLLAYPLFMFILLIGFFIAFRMYFLPNISNLILSRSDDGQETIRWSKFFLHVPDYFIAIGLVLVLFVILFFFYLWRKDIRTRIRLILRIPGLRTFYKLSITKQIARNLGNLLMAGFPLQQALQELKSQNYNMEMQTIASEMEREIIFGHSLSNIIQRMPYFFSRFELFVEHGEKNGMLGRELIMYCDVLDEKLSQYAERVFRIIQPLTFLIIAICIIAAYLSILLPMYKMIDIV